MLDTNLCNLFRNNVFYYFTPYQIRDILYRLRAGGGIKKPTPIISITSNGAFLKLGKLIIYIIILSNIQLEVGK